MENPFFLFPHLDGMGKERSLPPPSLKKVDSWAEALPPPSKTSSSSPLQRKVIFGF